MMWRLGLAAAAVAVAMAPIPPADVERFYSTTAFPPIQRTLTAFSNLVPFALFDALLVAIAGWWLLALALDLMRRSLGDAVSRAILRAIVTAAAVYLIFLITWGLNYRRVPLSSKIPFDEKAITAAAARDVARRAVDQVNALYVDAHSELTLGNPVESPSFADAFARAQKAVGVRQLARTARPKRSLLDPYFRAGAVEGMVDPFFLEILIAGGLLPFERPFVVQDVMAPL